MNYEQAVDYINSAATFGSKLGLENIRYLMSLLGNPQNDLRIIHVAGTNGKGSVCSFISHVMVEAGYRTGLFTSPYLEKFTERIQVDFENIPDENLIRYVEILKEKVNEMVESGKNHPTFFELNTAVALMYFKDSKCDVAVLETGLGGRLDSTNIVESPIVSVITAIGLDHTSILGDTIAKIAYEKAGIIKELRPVVVYGDNDEDALRVIAEKAAVQNSEMRLSDPESITDVELTEEGYRFGYKDLKGIDIRLLGKHQILNAATAVEALRVAAENGFLIDDDAIMKGIHKTRWPGRLEILHQNPTVICDATHNPQGAEVLRKTLEERYQISEIVFVMGVMKDKDYEKMASLVLPGAKAAIAVRPDWHRALDAGELHDTIKRYCKNSYAGDTIEKGLEKALQIAGDDGIVCTFGSLYYIADVKRFVRGRLIGIQ